MVAHLTFEELLEFNSLNYSEAVSGELASRVTTHIRTCGECRQALYAIQCADAAIAASTDKRVAVNPVRIKSGEGRREKLF